MPWVDAILERGQRLWQEALSIWGDGGWAMYALAVIALVIFGLGIHIQLRLRERGYLAVPERVWREWVDHPEEREGPIGQMLDFVTGGATLKETSTYFEQLRTGEAASFERDLRVMKIAVGAAPLLGLLGTVTGMLATFAALATGSGGDKTMEMVASGISEALITTETGLVIALPGLFFQYSLKRRYDRYRAFLAHMETVCTQTFHRHSRVRQRAAVQHAAQQRVASMLRQRLQVGTGP